MIGLIKSCANFINMVMSLIRRKSVELREFPFMIWRKNTWRKSVSHTTIQHSGLICVDIDAKDNPDILDWEILKQDLSVLPQIVYCALSVSGKGLFLVIPLRYPEKHLQQFHQLQIDFRKMGIMIDSACSDITRLRCLSYDEHPIINENATLYEGVYVEKTNIKWLPSSASSMMTWEMRSDKSGDWSVATTLPPQKPGIVPFRNTGMT